MKNKKRFLGLLLLYTKLCGDMGEVSLSDLSDNFQVIIDPLNKAVLSAQLSVPVKKIHKQMGDSFNKGDVLLELDNAIYVAQLKKARAVLEKAQNTYQAKEELFDARIASLSELKEAYALWATAQAELEVSKKQLEACKIVAPYRGKVASVLLFEHELPQVGQPLVEVVGDEVLLAKMLIDAKYLPHLSIDKPIEIYVNELKQKLTAQIKRIGSVIDPASSTIAVEAEIVNNDSQLIAGMTGFTLFSNETADTRFTIEEARPRPSVLEVPQKVYAAAKTILKNEGNFSESIKSGYIPNEKSSQQAPMKFSGHIDSSLAARAKEVRFIPPLKHEGNIDFIFTDYFYRNDDASKVYIAFQSRIDQALSPFYALNETKMNSEALNYNGSLNEQLAKNSIADKEKPAFYPHEGVLKEEIAFYGEEKPKEPLPFAGAINNEVALSSIEKSAIEDRLYSAVQEAEELNRFEEDLKNSVAPLSYVPDLRRPIKTASIPVSGKMDDAIVLKHAEKKPDLIAKTFPALKERPPFKLEPLALIDKMPKPLDQGHSDDHLEPIAHLDHEKAKAPISNQETLEEMTLPLSFIPELSKEEEKMTAQSLDETLEPLSYVPEIKTEGDKIAKPSKLLPETSIQFNETNPSIIDIEKIFQRPLENTTFSFIVERNSIAETGKDEASPKQWQEALFGGGSGGKEIE